MEGLDTMKEELWVREMVLGCHHHHLILHISSTIPTNDRCFFLLRQVKGKEEKAKRNPVALERFFLSPSLHIAIMSYVAYLP